MARRPSREELVVDYFRTAPLAQAEFALKLAKGAVKDRQRVANAEVKESTPVEAIAGPSSGSGNVLLVATSRAA
jgi:hypothetical protein